jgi:hydroxypyruvate reductase
MRKDLQELRADATAAFEAAVSAVQPANLVPNAVHVADDEVRIWDRPIPRVTGRRMVAAIGKAAPGLADAWLGLLPGWADEVFVLTTHGQSVTQRVTDNATVLHGGHPYPDADGEHAAGRLLEMVGTLDGDDLLIVLLSGGGSALLAAPEEGLTLDDVRATTKALLSAGATINQVNAVRRQLLAATGGGLGRTAFPAQVVTLVLSDVLGDPLPDIASGPTVASPTTPADALGVLGGHGIVADVPPAVVDFLRSRVETPTDDGWTDRSRIQVLANNRSAVAAAAELLSSRDYHALVHPGYLEGEAADRGAALAMFASAFWAPRPVAFVAGGETTVTVRGHGVGGRNHELALAAALAAGDATGWVALSAGTDGVDGMADAAGAVVDPTTVGRLAASGIDARAALADNDSGTALATIGDAIRTGPTGTNVCDVTMVLTAAR